MKDHKNLLISIMLCVFSLSLHAQSYNYESELNHGSYKSDDGTQKTTTEIGVKYFPVKVNFDNKSPFTELAFIQRKNNYSFSIANMQYKDSNFSETQVPIIGFGVRAIDANIFLEINYNQSDKKYPLSTNQTRYYNIKNKNYQINYGWYVLERTLLGVSVDKKTTSYKAGPGLTYVNDLEKNSNGLFLHSIVDAYHDQKIVLDLSYKLEKSHLQNLSTPKNHAKEIKFKYFPVSEFYFLAGVDKISGSDSSNAGNNKILGVGYAPNSNLNFLASKEIFTINNSDKGASHSNASASIIYKF